MKKTKKAAMKKWAQKMKGMKMKGKKKDVLTPGDQKDPKMARLQKLQSNAKAAAFAGGMVKKKRMMA